MTISESDRASKLYFRKYPPVGEFYSTMLIEDYSQNIASQYGNSRKNIHCSIEPNPEKDIELFKELFPRFERHHWNDDLTDIVLRSIEALASMLVSKGRIVLEYVRYLDEDRGTIFRLEPIQAEKLIIKRNSVIQIIPDDIAKEQMCVNKVVIPRGKCYIIEYPRILGGIKRYCSSLDKFKKLGSLSPLVSYFNNNFDGFTDYNYIEHHKMYELELWNKSKFVNWHHRQYSGKDFSSFYVVNRRLRFQKTRFILRDHIIQELKTIFNSCSKKIGLESELIIEGITPISKVDETIIKWQNGEIGEKEVMEVMN